MVDTTLAFNILARDKGASAVLDKVARASDNTARSLEKSGKVSDMVAKASDRLVKARAAESTALDRVQVAELRLSEIRQNSDSQSSKVVAAEKALAKARRDAAIAGGTALKASKALGEALDKEGKTSGNGFLKSLKSVGKEVPRVVKGWFTGNGSSVFKQLGENVGGGFMSSFLGVLKTPVIGPAVLVGITAAITSVAAPAGAIVAGGLVAGAGAGLAAIGLKFAAESSVVKQIWAKTASDLGGQTRTISAPFETTLARMSDVARRTFATFRPELEASFKDLAPAVTAFGNQVGTALGKLAPAVRPLSDAFRSVLGAEGPALIGVTTKLSASLIKLSESVQKNPAVLADLTRGVGDLAGDLVGLITNLNNADAAFKKLTGVSSVTALMTSVRGAVGAVTGPINLLSQGFTKLAGATDPVGHGFHYTATSAQEAATATGYWTQGMTLAQAKSVALGGAVAKSAHEIHAANVAAQLAASAFDRQTAATQRTIDALNRFSSTLLADKNAQLDYAQSVADATAAIKENGKTHSLASQKGRDNYRALLQVAAAAGVQRDAMLKANDGNVKAAASARSSRADFVRLATQMGYTVPQAKAMAASMIAIPNVTRTAKLQANKADLEAKLRSAKAQLADKSLTATKRAKLEATIAQLQAGIKAAKAALATVPASKTVNITTTFTTYRNLVETKSVGGIPAGIAAPHRAGGGPVSAGQPYIVGEKRPELFVPNVNGTILPKVPSATVGQSIASGLAAGVTGGAATAYAATAQVANGMIAKARDVLGIASPSKAFAQLGLYITQGFRTGLLGSAKQVQSAMSSLMSKVLNIAYNAADTKRSIQNTITTLNQQLAAARSKLKPITHGMSAKEVAAAQRSNRAVEATIRSLSVRLKTARTDLANVNAIASRLGTTPKRSAVLAMLQRENTAMQKLANARAVTAVQLKAAQDKLAAAVQVRDEFKQSITDAAISFNSIANIQPPEGGQLTASGIIAQMTETLRRTQVFAANLAKLKAKGLNATVYKQIAEAGVDQGGAIAEALLGGNANTFNTINRVQANINSAAAGLGDTAAKNLYQAGVDAAQGLVNGLLAKTKALDAASKKLAAAIVAQIKKTLGIRSPSKVLEWHGSMAGQGFIRGIEGEYGRARSAADGLGLSAVPGRSGAGAGARGAAASSAPNIYITVQGALDPNAVARQIQQLLLRYTRTGGVASAAGVIR